ncbi:hypothetical protein [Streptococcus vestibularis]|uniref:Uncharacterized protein n=1 Tax=Streptococcus vestibularis TaxID=1343 RepID=A0A564TW40_STRVE|nr:hypothetical protein [Streptococcus vestibularis]VUX11478.1 Uncharacterised protein [Streptococcus vestibularis]
MSLSQKLVNNISDHYVLQSNQRIIELTETKKNYSVTIRISGNRNFLLIKNIEDLKQRYLPYTNGRFMPKDCDYILILEDKKEIFFFELKSEKQKCFRREKDDIITQLTSGEQWVRHLIFCSTPNFLDINDFKMYFVAINKKSQTQCINELTEEKNGKKFTFWNGCSFNLSEFK